MTEIGWKYSSEYILTLVYFVETLNTSPSTQVPPMWFHLILFLQSFLSKGGKAMKNECLVVRWVQFKCLMSSVGTVPDVEENACFTVFISRSLTLTLNGKLCHFYQEPPTTDGLNALSPFRSVTAGKAFQSFHNYLMTLSCYHTGFPLKPLLDVYHTKQWKVISLMKKICMLSSSLV